MRPMRSILLPVVAAATLALATAPAAWAGGGDTGTGGVTTGTSTNGGEVGVAAGQSGSSGGGSATVQNCTTIPLVLAGVAAGLESWFGGSIGETDGAIAWRRCTLIANGSAVGWVTGLAAVPITDLMVASARSQLRLDLPSISTSPPRGGVQLVGIPVWFWVTNSAPVSATASIPGLSATLVATPRRTRVVMSGGTGAAGADNVTIDCPGGGTPWEPGRYPSRAGSDCSHPFDWYGTFTVDATVEWALTWTATNGQSGTLASLPRTTTFTLTIQEAQAVTD